MGTSSSCKLLHVCIGRFLALLLFVVVIPDLLQEAQTRRITFTEAPAKYTSNTSATFRSNLTSAANGSSSSIDTCATLCSIRCKVGRHFVDALAADQLDQRNFEHCAGREDSLVNLLDGQRSFVVSINTSNGVQFSTQYNWTVALVDASGRAELYGTTDRSIDPDRLVCRSRISILEASTPNLLIVHDPFVSLLRAPLPCLEHWWMPRAELSFMALQTDRSIPIDWSVGAGSAFSRRPPPIC
ncbi:unnamed protein product [Sphagnum jensenii]|uniref:Uncharacterized protein n=1 Tax=Sphagnum jensenii TaxID=128206 RepID=A0ABP0W331_9BRYO